jgi:hypothetical protein
MKQLVGLRLVPMLEMGFDRPNKITIVYGMAFTGVLKLE